MRPAVVPPRGICYHKLMTPTQTASALTRARAAFTRNSHYLFNRYNGFLAGYVLYLLTVQKLGGLPFSIDSFRLEVPVVLLSYFYFCHIMRPGLPEAFAAALPVFTAYAAYDFYALAFDQPLRLATLHEFPLLLKFLPLGQAVALCAACALPISLTLWYVDWRKKHKAITVGAIAITTLTLAFTAAPETLIVKTNGIPVTDINSEADNGRLITLIITEAQRRAALKKLSGYVNDPQYQREQQELAGMLARSGGKHSVHLVIMESLLDPTLFANIKLSSSAYSPEFQKLFGNKKGFSVSPVLGNNTAQPEFEILCGAPALRQVGNIEFGRFTGRSTACLPGLLAQTGYRTLATQLIDPEVFNAALAYRSAGFAERYFPPEFHAGPSYLSGVRGTKTEIAAFDGDLFSANTDFLRGEQKPVLNYVVTMYGHYPYYLDETLRPRVLAVTPPNRDIEMIANQFFYRTRALADFVNTINAREPRSLIIIVGDHLPFFNTAATMNFFARKGGIDLSGKAINGWKASTREQYRELGYLAGQKDAARTTRLFIMRDGKPVAYPAIHHYDIPAIVLDYVTNGVYCKKYPCAHLGKPAGDAELLKRYRHIMAEGSR